ESRSCEPLPTRSSSREICLAHVRIVDPPSQRTATGRYQEPAFFDLAPVRSDPKGSAEGQGRRDGTRKARLTAVKRKVRQPTPRNGGIFFVPWQLMGMIVGLIRTCLVVYGAYRLVASRHARTKLLADVVGAPFMAIWASIGALCALGFLWGLLI